ncbi:MAG: hypothetical protein A2Y88_03135 [Chloroflexi bacterium RBG_13_48_10]|nr:MAG: hypothetical protein A2Y88_03135 [Chloroflexi bacterium RBG_13_48_10]
MNKIVILGVLFLALVGIGASAVLFNQTYLPAVYKQSTLTPTQTQTPTRTSTPTVTPTQTPTPTPTLVLEPVLFPNGDFEQGPNIWEESSSNDWELILQYNYGLPDDRPPYDGDWAAWLGGETDEISWIQQVIQVPFDLPYMSYWYWIDSEDNCGYDVAMVLVNGEVADFYWLCVDNNTSGWVQRVVDLSAYAGSLVSIQIRTECDWVFYSYLFIDHVAFQSNHLVSNLPHENNPDLDTNSLRREIIHK